MTTPMRIPRGAIRYPVWITATCRSSMGRLSDVILSNLSTDGCGLSIGEGMVRPGQDVSVKLPSLEPLHGVVCWVKGQQAGVKFERPLYGPVLEHLVKVQLGTPPAASGSKPSPSRRV